MESTFFKKEVSMPKKTIIIFDFDLTISRRHLHGESRHLINELLKINDEETKRIFANQIDTSTNRLNLLIDKEQDWTPEQQEFLWNKLKENDLLHPTGTKEEWQAIFKALKEQDHPVYIASHSSFKFLIKRFLKEILEVDPENIPIVSALPGTPPPRGMDNKNPHLLNVLVREHGEVAKKARYEDIFKAKSKIFEKEENPPEGLDAWQQLCQKLLTEYKFILYDDTIENVNEKGIQNFVSFLIRCASEEQEPSLKELRQELTNSGVHINNQEPDKIPSEIASSLKERFNLVFPSRYEP